MLDGVGREGMGEVGAETGKCFSGLMGSGGREWGGGLELTVLDLIC